MNIPIYVAISYIASATAISTPIAFATIIIVILITTIIVVIFSFSSFFLSLSTPPKALDS